jgi:apolipoprotein N-acyltransferase
LHDSRAAASGGKGTGPASQSDQAELGGTGAPAARTAGAAEAASAGKTVGGLETSAAGKTLGGLEAPGTSESPAQPNGAGPTAPAPRAEEPTAAPIDATGLSWRGLNAWWSLAAAFAAGLMLAGAFPPFGFWPLAITGPAVLILAVWGKRFFMTFALSLTCGLVFYVALLSWLVNVAWYAWMALAIAEALIFAILAIALRPLMRLRWWPVPVAAWWVVQEAVHDRFPWGFPWGRLAMSQPSAPTAGWVAIGGPPLLTFLLALAGAGLAYLIVAAATGRNWRPVGRAAVVAVLTCGLALIGNVVWSPPSGPAPTTQIATIQGNVPHARNLPEQLRAHTVTENHAVATIELARQIAAGDRPAPAVVIWPENSTDIDPRLSPPTYAAIEAAVNSINRPILVGAVLNHPQRNAGQLWLPGRGPVKAYIKRQLVPFGEVIPFRGLLTKITSLPKLQPHNFTPGHRAVVFHIGRIKLGDVICYEVGFDNLVRSEVLGGANLLTVQTNDADFELDGQLGESLQQLAMARIDAISTDRAVAVASTTGLSAIIAPDGSIMTQSKTWQRAILDARVPLKSGLTPAMHAGGWPERGFVALTLLSLAWAIGTGLRRRRR